MRAAYTDRQLQSSHRVEHEWKLLGYALIVKCCTPFLADSQMGTLLDGQSEKEYACSIQCDRSHATDVLAKAQVFFVPVADNIVDSKMCLKCEFNPKT